MTAYGVFCGTKWNVFSNKKVVREFLKIHPDAEVRVMPWTSFREGFRGRGFTGWDAPTFHALSEPMGGNE